jgi:hypothetical protein
MASKRWSEANKKRVTDNKKNYRKLYPEKTRKARKAYYMGHKARFRIYRAKRRMICRNAMPRWANRFFMSEIYDLAELKTKMLGSRWHVDHIIPLTHPLVCGLHCESNLRVVPEQVNLRKYNSFRIE